MKAVSTKVPVLNALVYFRDPASNDDPEIDGKKRPRIWATSSCVAAGCLPDSEGDTEIVMGPSGDVTPDKQLLFDGSLETPSRRLIAELVVDREILRVEVPNTITHLQIWTDGTNASERITVGID
ncbi:hypothetical protein [Bauldia sp.]|uniref:hypothetical protein n=1 Tax=Bauldia sp. TaxID=2575872 RepID=UPI003BAD6DD7